jgi:hypothetical protein
MKISDDNSVGGRRGLDIELGLSGKKRKRGGSTDVKEKLLPTIDEDIKGLFTPQKNKDNQITELKQIQIKHSQNPYNKPRALPFNFTILQHLWNFCLENVLLEGMHLNIFNTVKLHLYSFF